MTLASALPRMRAEREAVPAAPRELRDASCYVTTREGGCGAVREVMDLIMKSAGIFGQALVRLGKKEAQPTQAELSSDVEKETWQ